MLDKACYLSLFVLTKIIKEMNLEVVLQKD